MKEQIKKGIFGKISTGVITAVCCCGLMGGIQADAKQETAFVPGIYEICSAENSDFVLDQVWCTEKEAFSGSGKLQMYRHLDVNQQKFFLEQLPGEGYRITSLVSGEVLAKTAEEDAEDSAVFMVSLDEEAKSEAPDAQTWFLEPIAENVYYIRSKDGVYLTRTEGTVYNGEALETAVRTGKKNQRWILNKAWIGSTEHADTDYINPYSEDGRCFHLKLSMYFGGEKEELTSETLASWIREEEHTAELDYERLTAYVQTLADRHNTYGQPRNFRTSHGKVITLYKGDFGWKLDVSATAEAYAERLDGRNPTTVQPVWSQRGGARKGENDIGDSYVEVDLVNQKVWLYKDGEKLLETECVTGTYGTDRQTPGGVYDINGKRSPAVLRGPGYESPVSYWMPFNGGIGLHDATWRSEFGGEIFRSNGSHGCVNLPLEAAKTIYETVSVGYPVVCYN